MIGPAKAAAATKSEPVRSNLNLRSSLKAQGYAFVDSIISSTEHSRSVIPSARLALAAVRRYRRVMDEQLDKILVTTMNDVPGYEIVAVYGEVFGLIVRARNVFSNFGASLRTLVGGEVGGYTTLLSDSRNHAIERLRRRRSRRAPTPWSRCASIATKSRT